MDFKPTQLLLSHTYFINHSHSFYVCVGLKPQTFKATIAVLKNKKFIELSLNDWIFLRSQFELIDRFFDKKSSGITKIKSNFVRIKLSNSQGSKRLLIGYQHLGINKEEWENIKTIFTHIINIHQLFQHNEVFIKSYYDTYVEECRRLKVESLDPLTTLLSTNLSSSIVHRLHQEIPILLNDKLMQDILLSFHVQYTDLSDNIMILK